MNISEVTNDIKLTLGLNTIALPYKTSTEQVIYEILQVSIRTFSRFKPHIKEGFEHRENLRSPDEMSERMGIFYLPEKLTTTHVQYADAYVASDKYTRIYNCITVRRVWCLLSTRHYERNTNWCCN